jgi:hypothetical protein
MSSSDPTLVTGIATPGVSTVSVIGSDGSGKSKVLSAAEIRAAAEAAPIASPTFTGTPAVPTATPGTNTTQAASTEFVTAAVAAGGGGGGITAARVLSYSLMGG